MITFRLAGAVSLALVWGTAEVALARPNAPPAHLAKHLGPLESIDHSGRQQFLDRALGKPIEGDGVMTLQMMHLIAARDIAEAMQLQMEAKQRANGSGGNGHREPFAIDWNKPALE
jgi:hypothetical protein